MEPVVPVPMEPELLNDLVEKAKDYALMHGETAIIFQRIGDLKNLAKIGIQETCLFSSRNLYAAEGRVRSGCAALCPVPSPPFALPRYGVSKSFEATGTESKVD